MENRDLITPATILSPGQCKCGAPLFVYDCEIMEIILNKEGEAIDSDVSQSRTIGCCQSCGNIIKMERSGFGYRPYNEMAHIRQQYEVRKAMELQAAKNPFGNYEIGDKK